VITAQGLRQRLGELDHVGIGPGGVNRLAWTEEDAACRAWFTRQAEQLGLTVARDPAGNLWACPGAEPPWWAVGSHLDSVRDGGRFDGPLGVACGFEIAAVAPHPVAVISFADEEGTRFNTPTFGSRALAGRLDLSDVLDRRDDAGITLRDALRDTGIDPRSVIAAPEWLGKIAGFIEVHIDQSTELARAGEPVGIVSALVNRLRLQAEIRGRADHAGTTPRGERRDALAAAARLIVAAAELSEGSDRLAVTTSRILVQPNAPTTIAARVRLWIDARAPAAADIDAWLGELTEFAERLASQSRVEAGLVVASRSPGREFSAQLRSELARASEALIGTAAPEVLCFAGHDAGVLAEHVPAAMLLVRNAAGISHAPEEEVDLADAAIAAQVVLRALVGVAGTGA
jgi:beta-ureidopropionase / N-carbamoyl-L-amino-acid hydrolase